MQYTSYTELPMKKFGIFFVEIYLICGKIKLYFLSFESSVDDMQKKPCLALYNILKWFVRRLYGKITIVGLDNLPKNNAFLVGNHTQIHGPIICELFLPENCYTWCAGQMMKLKEVPAYAYEDFWSQKPKWTHPFYKLLSYLIAPLAVYILNNARTIAVYRDMRSLSTFRTTVNKLKDGADIVILPECGEKHNNILYKFQENFVDVANLYYKRTKIEAEFVPMYIAPKLKMMYIGKPIRFCHDRPMEEERKRICEYLMNAITEMAQDLPLHTVIPYRNIPKKYYLTNKDVDEVPDEKTCR